MIVTTIPFSRLGPGNPFAFDYVVEPDKVLGRFAHDYRDPGALKGSALLDRPAGPGLGKILADYNREVGGSVENAARIDDTYCVVSGQQVGLLMGPAYTTYKLFTVINAARVLSDELGVDVVPVFWVESEDHDWAEVNRFFLKDRRFRLDAEVAPGTPVSRITADPGPLLADVQEALDPDAEAWSLVAPDEHVARWHVRNLARLVEGSGVVFVEPNLLREPMRPFAERLLASDAALDAALTRHDGPLAPPDGAYLFDATGARQRLPRGAALPEKWSTDVVSRVLVQNAAFRVLAAVCGPSEIHYWSQLKDAHEALGVPMPAVLPRDGATLCDKGCVRDAAKLGLDLEAVVRGDAALPQAGAADPVALRLRTLAGEAGDLFASLEDGSLDLPPNAEKPFRRTVVRLKDDLDKLAGRIDDARAEAAGAGRRRFERVLAELRPRGGLQERTYSLFPFLVRHGPGLADELRESFDPYEFGHYLVQL
ncbi:MAG: bacillithiol biosynthesis protein BshC [Planctomycetota bacterium]